MTPNIPLFKTYSDQDDVKAVADIIERGTYWADGPEIEMFEKAIAEYVGQKHAITFNNGTSALHALMLVCGIGPGDEVIVPSFTFISTANAPLFTGAIPVFADIEPVTYGLDPVDVVNRITDRTKAIIPVHYAGHPCQIGELKDIASDHGLLLLEDAAESMGSKFNGKMTGTFGDASMFSFCQNKVISTGEGGAIATNDEEMAEKLRLIKSHGRSGGSKYFTSSGPPDYISLGYNFRMPTICAALGLSQI
ncbi:MAG: DegT/DnrJ/EryC1/StrS family aminotransferase, partial [Thermoplasmata archaeon]|nr:DegT/DnrJ/EryC1/StrS family aminotransferase [Thermoplasmata archaeon]